MSAKELVTGENIPRALFESVWSNVLIVWRRQSQHINTNCANQKCIFGTPRLYRLNEMWVSLTPCFGVSDHFGLK